MKKFAIITDSCSDLPKDKRNEYDIDYLPMRIIFEGRDIPASLDFEEVSYTDFYNLMRDGVRIKTAQVNTPEFSEKFESYLKSGVDVLYIACSSALSGSYKSSLAARDELLEKYKDGNVICVDSRNSCWGLGLLCITAAKLRAEGKSLEEVASYIEKNKQRMNQYCTVESLAYLKRAGRVSAASAVFGGLLQVKPIIISDVTGQNNAIEKVKGRKNSFDRLVELFTEAYEKDPYQQIVVAHADCEEDAKILRDKLSEKLPDEKIEIGRIGPIVGASAGPGTVGFYGFGREVK